MKEKTIKRKSDNTIRFSIGAKLVTIITILILISLGTITLLVSYFVSDDLRVSAEANNLEVNNRAAAGAENTLASLRSSSRVIAQVLSAAGADSGLSKQAASFFFEQNMDIAALVFSLPNEEEHLLVNELFFSSRDMDSSLVSSFYDSNKDAFQKAMKGEAISLNASPFFGIHLLGLFSPMRTSGGGAVSVLYFPESLNLSFNSALNESFLINNSGDILIHPDFELVQAGADFSNRNYVRLIRESADRSKQEMFTEEGSRYYIAYTKLSTGNTIAITSIEYDQIFEGIVATTRRNLYLTAAVLFLSIMFIWFFSKTISTTLKILASAARRIEDGNFNIKLQPKGHDELTVLTKSFEKMGSALSIFGRFTNREVAVKAMRGEIKPGGLPKHATVFFSDIRNFTAKSENFTKKFGEEAPDKIIYWLNRYFTQMIDCVEKTNGVVDKFIGDAVMAHWGTVYTAGSPAKDAYNAVKAALMMRKALYYMNQKRNPCDDGDPSIQIGSGINTGVVTAGQLGSDSRMEYTVIGDPVNLASRIEALNKPLGTDILISENTWDLVKYHFITEEMPSVTVKGKEKPLRIFAVINHIAVKSGPKTLEEVRKMLNIIPPDLAKAEKYEEKKYKIGTDK